VRAALKIKEGISSSELTSLTTALKQYAQASKASGGKVSASYSIGGGEVAFFEQYESPAAMDIHIGNCFPHYIKMLPFASMEEIVCVVDPAELEFWKASASAWGAKKFIVTAANTKTGILEDVAAPVTTLDALAPGPKSKAETLIKLGLPEKQALKSVTVHTCKRSTIPAQVYAMLKINDTADMSLLTEALDAYAAASKDSFGKLSASYSIADGEVQFFEKYESPAAMDIHVGNCFPHYVKMLPHAVMAEIVAVVDPTEMDWWKESASAWGAKKFIVTPAL
jgi:quinol monooxygenase YgiN